MSCVILKDILVAKRSAVPCPTLLDQLNNTIIVMISLNFSETLWYYYHAKYQSIMLLESGQKYFDASP